MLTRTVRILHWKFAVKSFKSSSILYLNGEVMKLVMVNDCAFVGETLLKYMPAEIEKEHIKRGRGLWSKTFGLSYRILKAKGDLFHVHYLLQDCYIASRLGKKPLVGHAHGSDVRTSLDHPLWGRIVRHNLKNCAKLLVSTPDILSRARQIRKDAQYLPNPVDPELFYPKPLVPHKGKKKVLIASDSNWKVKGTDIAVRALGRIKDQIDVSIVEHGEDLTRTLALSSSLGMQLNRLPKVKHEKLNEYYWNADVVIDRFTLGSLGMVSLEAIACGRPAIADVSSKYSEYTDFPLKDVSTVEDAATAILEADHELWKEENDYLEREHKAQTVAKRLMEIYDQIRGS